MGSKACHAFLVCESPSLHLFHSQGNASLLPLFGLFDHWSSVTLHYPHSPRISLSPSLPRSSPSPPLLLLLLCHHLLCRLELPLVNLETLVPHGPLWPFTLFCTPSMSDLFYYLKFTKHLLLIVSNLYISSQQHFCEH